MRQVLIISDTPHHESALSYGRVLHTAAINAAAHGAWAAGASAVYLCQASPGGVLEEYLPPAIRELPVGSLTSCLRGLEEVKAIYRDHSIQAAIFVGYQGPLGICDGQSLSINGIPTRGLGLLAAVCQSLGAPVVAAFGPLSSVQEAEAWLPESIRFATEEPLPDGKIAYWPLEEVSKRVKKMVEEALDDSHISESVLQPPYAFDLKLPGKVQATRPLYFDVEAKEHSLTWKTHDLLYGWKVFWTLYAQNYEHESLL